MQDISLKPGCETVKNVIAFVVTREIIGKTMCKILDIMHLRFVLNVPTTLIIVIGHCLWPYHTTAGFQQVNSSGSVY